MDRLMDLIGQYIVPLICVSSVLMFFALIFLAFAVLLGWITP